MHNRKRSMAAKQERRVATKRGALLQPGSGSGKYRHHDSRIPLTVLIENKRTDKQQYTIKKPELREFCQRADSQGVRPEFHIEISGDDYVLLRLADHLEREDALG